MKFLVILILLFCSLASAEVRISNGKMTIDVVNQPLDKVLSMLREQTDIQFYVDDGVIDQSICADFQNLSVGLGIKKLLEGTGINYAVIARNGTTDAIFIGGSQKPQPFSVKLNARPTNPRPQQTNSQRAGVRKKQPAKHIESDVSIPTAGNLTTLPASQEKRKRE